MGIYLYSNLYKVFFGEGEEDQIRYRIAHKTSSQETTKIFSNVAAFRFVIVFANIVDSVHGGLCKAFGNLDFYTLIKLKATFRDEQCMRGLINLY